MPVISTAIGLGLAGASAAAGAIGKSKAASAQAKGADAARQLEAQNQERALESQRQTTIQQQQQWQPYTNAGTQGVNSLADLLKTPGQGLLEGYGDFSAPTGEQAAEMPGYKFALDQGIQALDKSAAAKGNLFSGTQGTALQQYGQGLATTNYQQAYQDALNSYLTNRDTFETNQGNTYNRLLGLTGVGESATGNLTGEEQQGAGNSANILMGGGAEQAQQINNAAAARASGYRGIGDSIAGGLNYGANWLQDQQMLQQLQQSGQPPDAWMLGQGTPGVSPQ